MRRQTVLTALIFGAALTVAYTFSGAQQAQIPTLQASNKTAAKGRATVFIQSRKDPAHAGTFTVSLDGGVTFDPLTADYPTFVGHPKIIVDMVDSVKGTVVLETVEQATTTGKYGATVYLSGRCKIDPVDQPGQPTDPPKGCRYWLMIADNKGQDNNKDGTPDIISFLVFNKAGKRVAHGTGPVREGDIKVAAGD